MITAEEIILINNEITQGKAVVISNPASCISSYDYYESTEKQIASIVRAVIKNHCFSDGNKRTGLAVLYLLAEINDIKIKANDMAELIERIASSKMSVEEISKSFFRE